MTRRLVGRGPLALAVVTVAAAPYLAACDSGPTVDGQLDVVQVCASRTLNPVRLPDSDCDKPVPAGQAPTAEWVYTTLPPSPLVNVPQTCYDEDGFSYECATTDIDTDAGGSLIAPVYAPINHRGGPSWGYVAPPDRSRIGRGVAIGGGTLTRSGAGTGGWGSPGSGIRTSTSALSRQPSPAISRGGLGSPGSSVSGAGSGPRGGGSSGS